MSSGDSTVTLFFDGLEIIYFKEMGDAPPEGVVLLPKRDDHAPSLDIFKIVGNTPIPIPHEIDISLGITIALDRATGHGVRRRDNSFDSVLNPQSDSFHAGNLEFKKDLFDKTFRVKITEGEFFSAVLTDRFPITFDVNENGSEWETVPFPFADVIGAEIKLSPVSDVFINDAINNRMILKNCSGVNYCVFIKNGPIPGTHSHPTPHPNQRHPKVTHFFFYYDVFKDKRDEKLQFDLDKQEDRGVPPQNCDPIILIPPPPES